MKNEKGFIDFTPLFWFGIFCGFIGTIILFGLLKLLLWAISHLEWIS